MSQRQSQVRQVKRAALKKHKWTFTDRVRESVRTGQAIKQVKFSDDLKTMELTK